VDPWTPLNAGAFRPIDLVFPVGSMTNCLPPTSHGASNVVSSERTASVVYGALAQAAPERAFAENLSSTGIICWGGEDARSGTPAPFVNMQLSFGSWGGTAISDGLPYCLSVVGNCSEIPVEILEIEYPFICLDKEFMIDTAGPGRFRGGPGITYTNRALVDCEVSLSCDRMRYGPWGLEGGGTSLPQALYEIEEEDVPYRLGWSPVESLRPISGRFDEDGRAAPRAVHGGRTHGRRGALRGVWRRRRPSLSRVHRARAEVRREVPALPRARAGGGAEHRGGAPALLAADAAVGLHARRLTRLLH